MAPRKILVIDDEQPTLDMFELFLEAYGYDFLAAENGTDGLALFKREKPDIVFTDIKMPGMDGFTVLDRIKADAPETEVIIITGHGDMDLAVQALNHEATDFINKPISRMALDAALNRAEQRLKSTEPLVSIARFIMEDEIAIIEIMGDIDAAAEAPLKTVFHDAFPDAGTDENEDKPTKLLVNFCENISVNGAGIAILIQILTECKNKGLHTSISGISENYQEIFKMVGITKLVNVFETKEAGLTYLKENTPHEK